MFFDTMCQNMKEKAVNIQDYVGVMFPKDGLWPVIFAKNGSELHLVGTSCEGFAQRNGNHLESITTHISAGEEAVVAMRVQYLGNKEKSEAFSCFVSLTWKDSKLIFKITRTFESKNGWLSMITPDGDMMIYKESMSFGTCVKVSTDYVATQMNKIRTFKEDGLKIIEDANLLCKVLVNKADRTDLRLVVKELQ